jgi:hypothetical protein
MTAWPQFRDVALADVVTKLRQRVLIDPWGMADDANASRLGFEYVRIGTGSRIV